VKTKQESFKSFLGAINYFLQHEKLSQSEGKQLIELYDEEDQNVTAIWEVYCILSDSQDMLESLKVVLIVLKKKQQAKPVRQATAGSENSLERDEDANDIYNHTEGRREE
jgi:rRNA pseudouridine-1189 N-methylase Emg1 (Nep1/Mra1 family)